MGSDWSAPAGGQRRRQPADQHGQRARNPQPGRQTNDWGGQQAYSKWPPPEPARRPVSPRPTPPRPPANAPTRNWWRIVRRVVAVLIVLLVVLAGYYVYVFANTSSTMASSHALDGAPTSSDGTNILLMGLDTRKDQDGRALPAAILDQLHAGDSQDGGYNTNTLILIHVPSSGKAQAFSIPRDDAVDVPGYGKLKIKEAYGNAKADAEHAAVKQGVTNQHQLETIGREAGRKLELDTVRSLTGMSIDHFAEISLAGFYDLANAIGGVRVCLSNAVDDSAYSGAVFSAGVQTLNGAQSLAFVRQRHGLPNGDLDRTHRQQAFLSSASHNIRSVGTILDPFELTGIANAAKRDIVIDDRWNALSMALELRSLTGGNTVFQTLPIEGFVHLNGEDANRIDVNKIRGIIKSAFQGSDSTAAVDDSGSPSGHSGANDGSAPSTYGPNGAPMKADSNGGIPCVN